MKQKKKTLFLSHLFIFSYKKTLHDPFFGWDSSVPKLQSHCKEKVDHSSHQELLVLIWSTLVGQKAKLTMDSPSGFELRTPGLRIQHLNH